VDTQWNNRDGFPFERPPIEAPRAAMVGKWVLATILVASCLLPLARAQYGRGGGNPRGQGGGYGGGYGGGGGGYGGSAYGQQQAAANAVARPGGDASLDDSVRLFLQLDQDGTAACCPMLGGAYPFEAQPACAAEPVRR